MRDVRRTWQSHRHIESERRGEQDSAAALAAQACAAEKCRAYCSGAAKVCAAAKQLNRAAAPTRHFSAPQKKRENAPAYSSLRVALEKRILQIDWASWLCIEIFRRRRHDVKRSVTKLRRRGGDYTGPNFFSSHDKHKYSQTENPKTSAQVGQVTSPGIWLAPGTPPVPVVPAASA
jgi:hypothetical protein